MWEAAVATGSWAMPAKEPAPSFGTAAQAAPKGCEAMVVLGAEEGVTDGAAAEGVPADAALLLELPLLPQALSPSARAPAARRTAKDLLRDTVDTEVLLMKGDGPDAAPLPAGRECVRCAAPRARPAFAGARWMPRSPVTRALRHRCGRGLVEPRNSPGRVM
ncbi:hypothetical protein GCM10009663_10980 [Kitasatospora arboriphila]|uniref:Uncharacterized protein n=1 Tax=Kitasatospora arboriphila TaxID=258052 RepID=A0ABN1TBP2_9ACTN